MVWPAAAPGSTFTPSPIIDALSSASTELENMRAQQSAEATIKDEKQSTQEQNSKPGYIVLGSMLILFTDGIR
jgi:hypothetical protein